MMIYHKCVQIYFWIWNQYRSGQGAFGNMCRGGRMFAPTKPWRRWHRRVNLRQRRAAVAAAVAAAGVPALVMARGTRVYFFTGILLFFIIAVIFFISFFFSVILKLFWNLVIYFFLYYIYTMTHENYKSVIWTKKQICI